MQAASADRVLGILVKLPGLGQKPILFSLERLALSVSHWKIWAFLKMLR